MLQKTDKWVKVYCWSVHHTSIVLC